MRAAEPSITSTANEAKPPAAPVDVAFLVDPCTESGIPADQCACAGDKAQTMIGAELLGKMAAAPADDDPALESYYSPSEMQRIVTWVEDAAKACGIEEASP